MTTSVVILSDLHINSTVALCEAQITLDDRGKYTPSKSQNWLRECYFDFIDKVDTLETDRKILILNGDLVDINTHQSYQLITENKAIILRHAEALISQITSLVDATYITRGTAAHVGNGGELEETLGQLLDVNIINGAYSNFSLSLNIEDVLFDISHHGTIGSTPWTRNNSLNRLASEFIIEAAKSKTRYPDIVIRSHVHTFADTRDNLPVRVIQTPAWQLKTEYSHRLGIVPLADIGGIIIHCDAGKYEVETHLYRPEPQKYLVV